MKITNPYYYYPKYTSLQKPTPVSFKAVSNEYKLAYPEHYFKDEPHHGHLLSYPGAYDKNAGLSLHPGHYAKDMGLYKSGGYLLAPLETPISTVGMIECAALYIPDKSNGKHFIWHVDKNTSVEKIAENIQKQNLSFDNVWIVEGCEYKTKKTVSNIIRAIESINPDAKYAVMNTSREEQEVIGYKGELFQTFRTKEVSFITPNTEYCC